MNIGYVGKHGSGDADDEGSIAWCLEKLGHKVECIHESKGVRATGRSWDLLLFHKWDDYRTINTIKCYRVFWFFDLVDFPDTTLRVRNRDRMNWMVHAARLANIGFCTDGDWVAKDKSGKLVWLTQGADPRKAGYYGDSKPQTPLLFTGIRRGGVTRESFVDEMTAKYGNKLAYYPVGVYGLDLAHKIANTQIVLAPDGPVTDNYWSNRVYTTLGYGGFMLHPYCARLREHYTAEELIMYRSRGELHELVVHYLQATEAREAIRQRAMAKTLKEHTYLHRVKQMLAVIKERLDIG